MPDPAAATYGPVIVRFDADPNQERTYARVRTVTACVSAAASALVLLSNVPVAVFLVALLGLAISVVWLFEARKAAQRAETPQTAFLAAHARGLLWADGPRPPIWVAWDEVMDLDVDEERLTVRVTRKAAPPLHIPPRYPGVEIHELVFKLRKAWAASVATPHG